MLGVLFVICTTSIISHVFFFGHVYIFATNEDDFTAVVSYSLWDYLELDQLYERMQSKRDTATRNTNVILKERICRNMISSRHFSMREQVPVDINFKLYKELKRDYPKIFEKLYEDSPQMTKLVNQTHQIQVRVKNGLALVNILEYAFVCVARNRQTGKLLEYYISETYNLNEASNWTDKYIAARFIFVPYYDAFSIRALAEQPASAYNLYIEIFYWRTRQKFAPVENVGDDTLCRLTKLEKVRVCASVLNSSHFRHVIRYSPKSDFIFDCQKMEVSFRTDEVKTEAGDTHYEEWMLWCLAEPIEADAQTEYFVSRAYHPNHVFVYTRDFSNREMYVENLSTGISVVAG